MRTIYTSLLLLAFFCLESNLEAQSTIQLSPTTIDFTTDCIEVLVGSTVDFISESDCGGTSAITLGRGAQVVFNTDKQDFRYTFDELGEYTLLCNLSNDALGSPTACISVVESLSALPPGGAVPTVGEWGIIAMMLILLIVATLAFEQQISHARI